MRQPSSTAAALPALGAPPGPATGAHAPTFDLEVVHVFPHDPHAFTEGLFYLNGYLYESTGLEQHSSIRKVRLETGQVVAIPSPCCVKFVPIADRRKVTQHEG